VETICFLLVKENNEAFWGDQIKTFPPFIRSLSFLCSLLLVSLVLADFLQQKKYVNVWTMMCSSLQKKKWL